MFLGGMSIKRMLKQWVNEPQKRLAQLQYSAGIFFVGVALAYTAAALEWQLLFMFGAALMLLSSFVTLICYLGLLVWRVKSFWKS